MKLAVVIVTAAIATPCLAQSPADEAAIREIETLQRDAVVGGDTAALEQLWSPAYVVNSPGNTVNPRSDVIDRIRKGLISYTAYEISIERIVFSGDVAVVMGAERVTPKKGPAAGKLNNRRFTDIWRRQGKAWHGIARHANLAPMLPPPPPAGP